MTDETRFQEVLVETMDKLTNRASIDNPNDQFIKGFATQQVDFTDGNEISNIVQSLQFDLGTIQAATNNFSDENKIGEGGFGMVYKGTLTDDQEITMKRLSKSSGQCAEEFKHEVVLVAKLQH
ncbi:hypothetical protein LguiA_029255 [Lonicera macranthoides]